MRAEGATAPEARAHACAGLLAVHSQPSHSLANERFAQFAAEGSHQALAEAFDLVAPELLRTASVLTRRAEEAAELVQDTFVAAIESRHRFEPGRSLVPWLVGILSNLHRYRSRAQARQIDPAQLTAPSEPEPSVLVDRKLVRETIERGIDLLPLTYREVVALHLRDGKRPEEIAQALERPAGRVRTQLWRGLRLLRDALP
jgi:RNA polymerase sigma-70 factor (ECF subfamily)